MIFTTDTETMPQVISRVAQSKGILVVYSIDRPAEGFVPDDDLRLHHDSVEFIDVDGTHIVLPFARIARIEIAPDRD